MSEPAPKREFYQWMQYVRLVILEEKMQTHLKKVTEQEWRDWYDNDVDPILAARAEIEKHRE